MDPDPIERATQNATGIAAMAVTGTWLAALLLGYGWWLPFMLFGYIVVVPLVAILFGDESDIKPDGETNDSDPLAELRRRYANGELTDEQFERKLDRLLETETLEDAAEWRQRETESARNR